MTDPRPLVVKLPSGPIDVDAINAAVDEIRKEHPDRPITFVMTGAVVAGGPLRLPWGDRVVGSRPEDRAPTTRPSAQ